ncbi:MAG: T9SS type A sorting domain-containing protein [Flavobacteriales bacterium]|nr:T9SS type A sorting domain-containing protein [Flavobacteriales bacterium]
MAQKVNAQVEDTTPPTLNSIAVSPVTVNNGDTVTITIDVSDDLSGVWLGNTTGYIVNPVGSQQGFFYNWTSVGANIYEAKIQISEWAISGDWYVSSMQIPDSADNYTYLNQSDLADATFNVTASSPDTTSPVFNSMTITQTTVNSGDTLSIVIDVTDNASGVWLGNTTGYLVNPEGSQQHFFYNWNSIGGNLYETKVVINEWAIGGEWYVASMQIPDNADNYTYIDNSNSVIGTVNVNALTPDNIAPVVNSVTVTPSPVNYSDTITITINVTDNAAGVWLGNTTGNIVNPQGGQQDFFYNWDSIGVDLYQTKVKINDWALSGLWYISNMQVPDNANNYLYLSSYDETIATFIVNGIDQSISELDLNKHFIVYPNPTSDRIMVIPNSDVIGIEVRNASGLLISKSRGYTTSLAGNAPGLYFVSVETELGKIVKRVILK